MSKTKPHEVIEEVIDTWMLEERLANQRDKGSLWVELGDALGVTDRQVKRYYTGETPLPIDKVIALCNHIKSPAIAIYLAESVESLPIDEMDEFDFVEQLIKNIDHFSLQARVAVKALTSKPTTEEFRELQAAGRRLRIQLKQFEEFYYQTVIQYEETKKKKIQEGRARKTQKLREALEAQGQGAFSFGDENG